MLCIRLMDMIDRAQLLAKEKGGRCLTSTWTTVHTPILWQCGKGHTWSTSYVSVKYNDSWCPRCSIETRAETLSRRSYTKICEQAAEWGLKCLTPVEEYYNAKETWLSWECLSCFNSHQFEAKWGWVKKNKHCIPNRELSTETPDQQISDAELDAYLAEFEFAEASPSPPEIP